MSTQIIRRIILSLLAIALLLGGGYAAIVIAAMLREEPERQETKPTPIVTNAMQLHRGEVVEKLKGYGLAQPLRQAQISAQASGEVVDLPRANRVGARVKKGDVLLQVDDTTYRAELKRREAMVEEARQSLRSAEAQLASNREKRALVQKDLELASRELERRQELFGQGAVSESQLDQARERVQSVDQRLNDIRREADTLQASVARAGKSLEARLAETEQAAETLADTTVEAPFTGYINHSMVDQGDYVQPGQPLFSLVSLEALELPIEIPASRAMALKEGAPAALVTDEEPPRRASGRVERISPTVDAGTRTVSAYVVINSEEGEAPFPPGTFLTAAVDGRVFQDVIAIPRSAIVDGGIFVADGKKARRLEPEFFVMLDDMALTREDLPEGTVLLTSGFERLYDGAPIEMPSASPAPSETETPSPVETQLSKASGKQSS